MISNEISIDMLLSAFIVDNQISSDLSNACLINKDNAVIFINNGSTSCDNINSIFTKLNEDNEDAKKKQVEFISAINQFENFLIDKRNSIFQLDKRNNLYFKYSNENTQHDDTIGVDEKFLMVFNKYPIDKDCTRIITQIGGNQKFKPNISKFPKKLCRYDSRLFAGIEDLLSIKIPDNIIKIEKSVFQDCHNLSSVLVPNNISTINEQAFLNCSSLISIDISNTHVDDLNEQVFMNCSNLSIVILPSTLKTINKSTFTGCKNLKFIDCRKLKHPFQILIDKDSNINDDFKIVVNDDIFLYQYMSSSIFLKKHLIKQSRYKNL